MSPKHSAVISMDIPIFSGLQRKAQLEQAKIELEPVTGNNVMKYIDKSNELIAETAKNLKLTNYHELASRAADVYKRQA